MGCIGLCKHNGVLSEFGKIREIGKMCHVMSIDEYRLHVWEWFNVLMTEFIVVSGRKDRVDLAMIYRHVVIFVARFG